MKSILFKAINIILFTTSAYANEIYVNQVGSDLTLEIQQRSEDNYVNIYSTGNNNTIVARQGMHEDGTIDVDETGGHEVYWTVTGDGNNVASYQTDTNRGGGGGDIHHIANIVNGDSNIVKHTQMGKAGHTGYIEIQGDSNNVSLLQRGNGGQKTADIVLTGDGHSVDSDQRGSGSANLELDLTNSGGSYNVQTNQDTSTTHRSYSLTGSCADANGCSVSVTQN
jgi:hypothetical protein